jgi:DnaJ-class molecular chaperone
MFYAHNPANVPLEGIDLSKKRGQSLTNNSQLKYASANCLWCKGSGKDESRWCGACDGKGQVLVSQPALKCIRCEGTGVELDRMTYRVPRCVDCGGTGWDGRRM